MMTPDSYSARPSSCGFTLIELMIVVTIIGILAAIAIPTYGNYVAKAQFSEALSLASGLKPQVMDAHERVGKLEGIDNGTDSIPAATAISGQYVSQVDVKDGVITAHFGPASRLAGQTMTLAPKVNGSSSIGWTCTTTVAASRAPASCR